MAEKVHSEEQVEVEYLKLLKDEGGALMWEEGITTVTFYELTCTPDQPCTAKFQTVMNMLRTQFAKAVAANPWLAGSLVTKDKAVSLRYPAKPSEEGDIPRLFTARTAEQVAAAPSSSTFNPLVATQSYRDICTSMYDPVKGVVVCAGCTGLDQNKPVVQLTLTESTSTQPGVIGGFSLVFSMSHAVADGRTYYEILNMLKPASTVWAMESARLQSFSEAMRDQCGRKELEWADTTSAACMYTCAMVPLMLGCAKAPRCVAFELDGDKLAAAKAKAVADSKGTLNEATYVTTNDVLTSGFFNEVSARIGMMGMDCRNRISGVDKGMAGNYVTALTMDTETFATPQAVRKMLSSMPYECTLRPLPGCCAWLTGRDSSNFAMATNWSSFAGQLIDLHQHGCEMNIHLPAQNPAYALFDLMIPFARGAGKVGVICWTVSSDEDGLRAALPVGACLSRSLFPSP